MLVTVHTKTIPCSPRSLEILMQARVEEKDIKMEKVTKAIKEVKVNCSSGPIASNGAAHIPSTTSPRKVSGENGTSRQSKVE